MNIVCTNVTKAYNGKTVLHIDTLTVQKGAIVGIIGANGCGKSTLLYTMANLLAPDTGDIRYNGAPFDSAIGGALTMVFQKPMMLRTTAYKNIAYPLAWRKVPKDTQAAIIGAVMDKLALSHVGKQMATTLSGGEKQKIALARSAVIAPALLLLDEPTASIDPASIKLMEGMMKDMNAQGTTIVLVTHNLMQAKRMCTDIVFLEDGRVVEQGNTARVLEHPTTDKLQNFMEYGAV